ncbi:polyprenyl synthetase family protein [Francisella philomiragia]|uniref:Polyprenyl synthetase family protein n=1 Tax=Francisella philomiragia TaxID=28110 RepID=A0ABS1GD00_9GAMM|nr:polyprenyl synthetase family protein [Francisella philomiragia]AJI57759.1 polyprenyl synthetase family protein [Francisella philomiragia]MBK2025122.1 polyprenyl synthetase family protein [Francisella philomiragia]MBK2093562.1 polyprenyl synthetase family protein [Francisella philomiragia]MBK2258867.1 polyprenyl synthetase family protein [Francisella philomiragia]MBK2302558.1 polyprenyl synthetase family protein [Francisella philomiragia]
MQSLKDIQNLIKQDIENNNQFIINSLSSEVVLINQISHYIINSGGKRLRPLLVMLFSRALNYTGNDHLACAAIIEFIHTATLLHDDVVDDSHLRRGKETANNVFGNAASVLTGDFLYSRAFQMMVGLDNMQIMQILADATNKISEGEVLQLLNARNIELSEEDYTNVIYCKTAKLFEAACELAGVISLDKQSYSKLQNNIKNYGVYLGNAFQIADDVLDYVSDAESLGKNIGDDLDEGKMTLPTIYALANTSTIEQKKIKDAIEKGQYDISEIINIVKSSGAVEYSYQVACQYADKAKESISFLPESEYKQAMIVLCDLAVERKS